MGIVLQTQLDRKSHEFDERLLKQRDEDSKFSERWVISQAVLRRVIPQAIGERLHALYESRNKCIHRYIISDVNYDFATRLVFSYDDEIQAVTREIKRLEERQLEANAGFVVAEADTAEPGYHREIKRWVMEMAADKERRPKRGK